MPVLLLLGGLAVLVVGLVLLTGGGPRTSGPLRDTRDPDSDEPPTEAPCDWSAWVELEDDERLALRAPTGRACCSYVLRVRDLDPVTGAVDESATSLSWAGSSTRIGPDGATTPLERDVVRRHVTSTAGALVTALAVDRSPGPEVTTPGWRELPAAELAATGAHDSRTAQLWQLHLDELRGHGARPVPTDGPRVAPLVHRRRVEVALSVARGCRPAAHRDEVDGDCRARLEVRATPAAGRRLAAPLLASWIQVGEQVVVADTPTAAPAGLSGWHPATGAREVGVAAVCDPGADTSTAEWTGRLRTTDVDERAVTLVVGSQVQLEADVEAGPPAPEGVVAELRASTDARVRLRLGQGTDPSGSRCTRCVPALEVVVGRPAAPGVRTIAPGTTADVQIRLDGRTVCLHPPEPGGTGAWTVAQGDRITHAPHRPAAHEVTR